LRAGRRGAAERVDAPPRGGDFRGAVGLRGVVTVRAVRPFAVLAVPPDARDDSELPAPAFELRVLVFPAMRSG